MNIGGPEAAGNGAWWPFRYDEKPSGLGHSEARSAPRGGYASQSPPRWRVCAAGHGVAIGRTGLAQRESDRNRQRHSQQQRFHRFPTEVGPRLSGASSNSIGQPFRAHLQRDAQLYIITDNKAPSRTTRVVSNKGPSPMSPWDFVWTAPIG